MDKPNVYSTLKSLLKSEPEAMGGGKRVYRVSYGADSGYVLTNSPGNAALAVCDVEGVKPKEITEAAFELLHEKQKGGAE